jgi:hypothetical protein
MSTSKNKRHRLKLERSGSVNPEISRSSWARKPQTQVICNMKAEQRRSLCRRRGIDDGAVFNVIEYISPRLMKFYVTSQ